MIARYESCTRSMPCFAANDSPRPRSREATATGTAPSTCGKSAVTLSAMRPGPTTPQRRGSVTAGNLLAWTNRQDGPVALMIDPPVWPWRGRRWSHLVSDVSYEELHAFVQGELGIPRRAFQGDHYDIPEELHDVAVAAGAEDVSCRELLGRLRAAGLRKPKRHVP